MPQEYGPVIPHKDTYFIVAGKSQHYHNWVYLRKSGRDGNGVWKITTLYEYAERLETLARAKTALKSKGVVRLKGRGYQFEVYEDRSSATVGKVWPLSPLEQLAKTAVDPRPTS